MAAFLTEVNVETEFAPPAHIGVKLRNPGIGEKELIFPEVRPRKFEPYSPGHAIFGAPKWHEKGKKPAVDAAKHMRSRNIHGMDMNAFGQKGQRPLACEEEEEEEGPPQSKNKDDVSGDRASQDNRSRISVSSSKTPTMPPISPGKASYTASQASQSVVSSTSSFCSTCCSSCSCSASAVSCSTCAEAARRHALARARRRARQNVDAATPRSHASSATSSVPYSAYENLTSVSQIQSHSTGCSHRSRRTTASSAVRMAKLQDELDKEKKQREATDRQVIELQKRQDALLAKLRAVTGDATERLDAVTAKN